MDRHLQCEAKIYLENLRLSANSMTGLVSKGTVVARRLEVKHNILVSNKLKRVKFPQ